jgi:eukaryotic-like serine/threonine-protein kinase
MSAVVVTLLALSGGTWWYFRSLVPAVEHPPVTVLIADFQNATKDPTFDRTLEPVLKLALEGASFISAYDRTGLNRLLDAGARAPATFDEPAARSLAVKQGVGGVVVSGSIERQPRGYTVAVRAVQAVTGDVITTAADGVSDRKQVLGLVTRLAADVRTALGDETSDSRFTEETNEALSATSLDVVHHYALAMDALSNSKNDDALRSFSKAVDLDPNFGLAYAGMAIASRNLDRDQDAQTYAKQAVRYLDGMTPREELRTRGLLFLVTGDYENCANQYRELTKKYPADAAAQNNLALCLTHQRNLTESLAARQRAVSILPKRSVYRFNLAIDATYAGQFQIGEREAGEAQKLGSPLAAVALAFSQLAQGRVAQAVETYQELARQSSGASRAASGLGELAAYEGRFKEAVAILERGAATDLMAGTRGRGRAAEKYAALASIELARGQKRAALAAADKALANSQSPKVQFLVARVFVDAGEIARAQKAADALASELEVEPQALAKIINGEIALNAGRLAQAVDAFNEANKQLDTWIGRFDLGRAYLKAGRLPQADSEFGRCIDRRGEALSLFLDDEPTFSALPLVYYYRGRVREELKTAGFAESYRTYLAMRSAAGEDPLLPEVRKRAGN